MTLSAIYWTMMLLWLILSVWSSWPTDKGNWRPLAGNGFLFVLLVVLGWQVFGDPVK